MVCLFISCVSHEFAHYRDALRHDLGRPNLEAKIQEDFYASGGPTLEKLDDYIRQCDAVIHLCGDMTGSMANPSSVAYIQKHYPDFGSRFPELIPFLEGTAQMSYTQWEAWLAIYHGKRLIVAAPAATAKKDPRFINDPVQQTQQKEHATRLRQRGFYDEIHFRSEDDLSKQLYRSKLGDILNTLTKDKPANLPYQSIGSAFKGRKDFLKELHDHFFSPVQAVTGIAVHALGGTGKTRTAIEYAHHYTDEYAALLFVSVASPETFTTHIANLAAPGILNLPEHTALEEEIKYTAVINWLNQYKDWLLIIDNADTPEAAEKVEAFFAQLRNGHILITSRVTNWSLQIKKTPLDVLTQKDAIDFLLETTDGGREKRADDEEMAGAIVDELGRLALALEQARAFINTKEISLAGYFQQLEAKRLDVLAWVDKHQMKYPASVVTTWQATFSQLSPAAITLLNRLSFFSPEPIPKTVLEIPVPDTEDIDATEAWEELRNFSLATSSEDKKSFSIHKLVQDITRLNLAENIAEQALEESLNWLTEAFIGDPTNVNDWPALEPYLQHVIAVLKQCKEGQSKTNESFLLNQTGVLFLNKAQYNLAELLLKKALQIDEQNFGKDHPDVAIRLNNLAQLFQHTNRLVDAEPLMRRALEIDEKTFGKDHPTVAIRLNNLAQLLQYTNRLDEAEPLMRTALEIDEQSLGNHHPHVARDLNNLAQLLQYTNRLDEAEPLMRRALEIDQQSLGKDHPTVAIDLNNLAILLQETNRLDEAEHLMRRALKIDEQSLGKDHPTVAIRLNNLAQLLKHTNRLQEAEPLMRRALEIDEQSLGNHHPNVAKILNNLALLLLDTNRLQEAEPLMRRALKIDEQSLGKDHPTVAIRLNNLSILLQETNRLQEAEPLTKRGFVIFLKSLGHEHPNTQKIVKNYISILKELDKSENEIKRILIAIYEGIETI